MKWQPTFNYIRYGIFKLKTIFNKHIVLKLPIEDGYNLFYVTRGEIILKEKYRKLNDKDIEDFIRRGKGLVLANPKFTDEKISMDFHDILYSEINSLPDEMVMIL